MLKAVNAGNGAAYELFKRAYEHHMGQFLSKIWKCKIKDIDPRDYVESSFEEDVVEYSLKWANSKGFELEYNPADKAYGNIKDLREIEVEAGYWLCHYDGHTGSWYFWWHESRTEAKEAYRRLYTVF